VFLGNNMTEYLSTEAERLAAIISDTDAKFSFQHQSISDIAAFSSGIFKNQLSLPGSQFGSRRSHRVASA
jgi:hypothetical protein